MNISYLYRHRKTQEIVRYLAIATEKTDDTIWYNGVVYCSVDNPHQVDFCHEDVFQSRFEMLLQHEIIALGLE